MEYKEVYNSEEIDALIFFPIYLLYVVYKRLEHRALKMLYLPFLVKQCT